MDTFRIKSYLDGNLKKAYVYNEQNRLISEKLYTRENAFYELVFEYQNDKKVSETYYSPQGDMLSVERMHYNPENNQRLTTHISFRRSAVDTTHINESLNSNGQVIVRSELSGGLPEITRYSYNSEGLKTKAIMYSEPSIVRSVTNYDYDKNGQMVREEIVNSLDTFITERVYDQHGNWTSTSRYVNGQEWKKDTRKITYW